MRVSLMVLLAVASAAFVSGTAAAPDCDGEVAALVKDEGELPRLEVVSPADRPPYCITIGTIMAFAGRLKAHIAHCPNSTYASNAADWIKMRSEYSKLFARNRCRPTMRN